MTPTFERHPDFGWDGWLNPATNPRFHNRLSIDVEAIAGARIFTGADTIGADIGLLPAGLDMYASYVDNFGGFNELAAAKGSTGAFLLSITIFGSAAHPARCADVETGAMHATDLPHWLDNVALRDGGLLPWVYTNAANMGACNAQIGSRKVVRWSAHFGFGPHICGPGTCGHPQADWTQWTNAGPAGQNFDRSIGTVMPLASPVPLPPPPPGVDPMALAITAKPDGNLVALCESQSGEVFQLWTTAPGGSDTGGPVWHGKTSVTSHKWVSLGTPGA